VENSSIWCTPDAIGRLTSASTSGSTSYPAWGLSFGYDRYGNRLTQSIASGCTGLTCPTNSVTASATTNHITTSGYSYDANGNMTNDGVNTLTYDAENRLLTSSGSLGSGTYTYDGNGLRVNKVSGGTTTVYIYSGPVLIAEYINGAAPSSPTNEYFYSGSKIVASVQSGSTYYFHNDRHSLRVRTNSSGGIQDQRGTFPFGETWFMTVSNSEWLFTNYQRDSESSNDYAWAREYVNRLGRFSSGDPVSVTRTAAPRNFNRYSYVASDPINRTDRTGMLADYCNQDPGNQVENELADLSLSDPFGGLGPFGDPGGPLGEDPGLGGPDWLFCGLPFNEPPRPQAEPKSCAGVYPMVYKGDRVFQCGAVGSNVGTGTLTVVADPATGASPVPDPNNAAFNWGVKGFGGVTVDPSGATTTDPTLHISISINGDALRKKRFGFKAGATWTCNGMLQTTAPFTQPFKCGGKT
jgi:RHS repeat-associated protein